MIKFDSKTMAEMAIRNRLACKVVDIFDWMFRKPEQPLGLFDLWNNLFGFDIVRFDEEVVKSGDACLANFIEKSYGQMGKNLIKLLISTPEEMSIYLDSPEGRLNLQEQSQKFKSRELYFTI